MVDKRARARALNPKRIQGRPSGLTDEVQRVICAHMQIGGYLDDAAHLVGLGEQTILEWIDTGRAEMERQASYAKEWGTPEEPKAKRDASQPRPNRAPNWTRPERKEAAALDAILRKQNEPFLKFAQAVWAAQSTGTAALLASITKAAVGGATIAVVTVERTLPDGSIERTVTEKKAPPDWRAGAFRMERRNPKKWGVNAKVELGGSVKIESWKDLALAGEEALKKLEGG